MRFFRMRSPQYSSEMQDLAINGNLVHIYRFPAVSCISCKATYGGSRILSISAPRQIQNDKRFKNRWPVSDEEHALLQREVAGYLDKECVSFVTFRPGDIFQPAYLDIPTIPTADFLWPNIRSFVISERMKKMVFDKLAGYVEIVPVQFRKVGKRNGRAAVLKEGSNEPKNNIQLADHSDHRESIGPYYQVLVRSESDYPKGGKPVSVCPVCKREAIDDKQRELTMTENMWRGQPIFFLRTTLYIVVTEPFAEIIRKAHASNVDFIPY